MSERSERTMDIAEPLARGGRMDSATEAFVAHRNLLFTVAYEMLGSAADAEDVLQETWLRWVGVDLGTVRDQRAYLVRITTRQALSRLRTLRRRKESYVGPWLPEPLLTAPDVAEDVELADSVSMAMLLVLETLTPTERAVFVLGEVFDLAYDEIAGAVGKSPAAVRQIAHRARAHVAARRPRGVVSAAETRGALEAFQRAVETGGLPLHMRSPIRDMARCTVSARWGATWPWRPTARSSPCLCCTPRTWLLHSGRVSVARTR
jgi:RNA polymerase sigma factor (sigma-70 family)